MKILIVKLSSLGDVVHAMPAVQDILQALPMAQIDWLAQVPIQVPVHSAAVARSRLLRCARALGYAGPEKQSFSLLGGIYKGFIQSNCIASWSHGASGRRGTVALVHGTSRLDKEWPLAHRQAVLRAAGRA